MYKRQGYTELYGEPEVDKWTFSTNGVAIMGRHGIPTIGLGPGKEEQAHAPNEITWKDDLVQCAAIYATLPAPVSYTHLDVYKRQQEGINALEQELLKQNAEYKDLSLIHILFMIMRVFDAVNDPFMGMIVDNTTSVFGKFKPWIASGALVSGIFTVLLFVDLGLDGTGFILAFAVIYLLWEVDDG